MQGPEREKKSVAYFTDGKKASSEKTGGWKKMYDKLVCPLFPLFSQLPGSAEAEPESLSGHRHLVL